MICESFWQTESRTSVATNWDMITVGGGVAGASLARCMADAGKNVLVLEREKVFTDRVRGEWLSPWGVTETQLLGAFDVLKSAGAHELPLIQNGPVLQNIQDESPDGNPALTFYHPDAQQALIDAARDARATVEQGARVTQVAPGTPRRLPTPVMARPRRRLPALSSARTGAPRWRASLSVARSINTAPIASWAAYSSTALTSMSGRDSS